jgi:hypothetical protein
MFDKWLKLPAHYYLHITALSLLIVGVALSNVLMSIGTIWIIANWLIELDFNAKWERFKQNKIVIAFSVLFLLMVLSIGWSTDVEYGLKDLLIKLPLITIPLVMGTRKKLEHKIYIFLLYLFIGSLTFTTIYNYIRFDINELADKRSLSFFISHIRLGGLICLAIFLIGNEIIKNNISKLLIPILMWLLYYIYFSQTITAYLLLLILSSITLVYLIKSKLLKLSFLVGVLILIVFTKSFLTTTINENIAINTPKTVELGLKTASDHFYFHDLEATKRENGYVVWVNISERESRKEWNKRSEIKFDSTDNKGNNIMGTLFGYLTSKNLRKDSLGLSKLNENDILNIENGQSNYLNNSGFNGKITKLTKQYLAYSKNENPNGHSIIQRIEHLKTGLEIVKSNWLVGVGIGDVNIAFQNQYAKEASILEPQFRLRTHNQFITLWISMGIVGFLLILYILFKPFFTQYITFTTVIISITLLFSFLTQDMIETQAGVTIFALFYSLGSFLNTNNQPQDPNIKNHY